MISIEILKCNMFSCYTNLKLCEINFSNIIYYHIPGEPYSVINRNAMPRYIRFGNKFCRIRVKQKYKEKVTSSMDRNRSKTSFTRKACIKRFLPRCIL